MSDDIQETDWRAATEPVPSIEDGAAYAAHLKCESVVDQNLEKHPLASFMFKALQDAGCGVSRRFFKCLPCKVPARGFYMHGHGIIICENVRASTKRIAETMTHEMVHAYDACTKELDLDDCVHHTCTEIRASNLSGECHLWRDLSRPTPPSIRRRHQECVRQRVRMSTQMRPACRGRSEEAILAAWSSCYSDLRPFGVVP